MVHRSNGFRVVSRSQTVTASGQLPLSVSFGVPPEVGWAISASGTAKGMNLITYIRATPSVEYSTLHLGQYVMRFMPFAVLLALITHPTSGGTQNETLNGCCPDCYSERNSLASRD